MTVGGVSPEMIFQGNIQSKVEVLDSFCRYTSKGSLPT